jgi:hypothetical protein
MHPKIYKKIGWVVKDEDCASLPRSTEEYVPDYYDQWQVIIEKYKQAQTLPEEEQADSARKAAEK